MQGRDALGRRRAPDQGRGLRPIHPVLPPGLRSRSVRIAMSIPAWVQLDRAVAGSGAPTTPRAIGEIVERALAGASAASVADWQEWQIRKEQQLLARRGGRDAVAS